MTLVGDKNLFKGTLFHSKKVFKINYGEDLLDCPRWRGKMKKIKKRDVIIDVCKKCNGMWLDDNEIEKLLTFTGEQNGKKE